MTEKITLRLKSNHDLVLPEASLYDITPERYLIAFPGANTTNYFPKRDWEPVPPPYILPTGLGAVVEARRGDRTRRYTYVGNGWWVGYGDHNDKWKDAGIMTMKDHVTLSEGLADARV